MAPNEHFGRPRVYLILKRGKMTIARVLDLAFVNGAPVAVLTWLNKGGALRVDKHIPLDPKLLRKGAPVGTFRYEGVAIDPH